MNSSSLIPVHTHLHKCQFRQVMWPEISKDVRWFKPAYSLKIAGHLSFGTSVQWSKSLVTSENEAKRWHFLRIRENGSALLQPGLWKMLSLLDSSCYFHNCMRVDTIKDTLGQSGWKSASTLPPTQVGAGMVLQTSSHAPTAAGEPWKLQHVPWWHITFPPSCGFTADRSSIAHKVMQTWDSSWYDFWSSLKIRPLFFQSSVTQLLFASPSLTLCSSASFELEYSHFSSYCISCESFVLPSSMCHLVCRGLCLWGCCVHPCCCSCAQSLPESSLPLSAPWHGR